MDSAAPFPVCYSHAGSIDPEDPEDGSCHRLTVGGLEFGVANSDGYFARLFSAYPWKSLPSYAHYCDALESKHTFLAQYRDYVSRFLQQAGILRELCVFVTSFL